jgi:hypothetical protein
VTIPGQIDFGNLLDSEKQEQFTYRYSYNTKTKADVREEEEVGKPSVFRRPGKTKKAEKFALQFGTDH